MNSLTEMTIMVISMARNTVITMIRILNFSTLKMKDFLSMKTGLHFAMKLVPPE